MGISSITSTNSMPVMQVTMANSTDTKNKSIQKEISDVQQQVRALSSNDELSVNEKANERKTLQKKISSLNTELSQHQEELNKSQRREIMMAELLEDKEPGKSGNKIQKDEPSSDKTAKTTENGISDKETKTVDSTKDTEQSRKDTQGIASENTSAQQAGQEGTVITKSSDGIVILKEEMNQNAKYSVTENNATGETSFNNANERILPADTKQTSDTQKEALAAKEPTTADSDVNTDTGLSRHEMLALVSAASSVQQVERQGTVIARINGGIAVLKGEMNQDEQRGINTDQKQEELEKIEQREQQARTFQSSVLGEANNAMRAAAKTVTSGITNWTQDNTEMNNPFRNAFQLSQEVQASQQRFYISLD